MNSRLDNLQAAALRIKLKYLDGWLEARRKNAEFYREKLKGLPVITPYVPVCNVHTYHQYTLRVHRPRGKGRGKQVHKRTRAQVKEWRC